MRDLFDDGEIESTPFYLFLGTADSEGVTSSLKTSEIEYKRKMLDSGLDNWKSIFRYLAKPNLAGVILKLPAYTWETMLRPEYITHTKRLLKEVSKNDHIAFLHESIFAKAPIDNHSENSYYEDIFTKLSEQQVAEMKELLEKFEINFVPYQTNAEMTVLALEFLDNSERNLLFRFYVPQGQIWSDEIGKILNLFRDFITRISGFNFKEEEYSTRQGVIYEFFGDDQSGSDILPMEFGKFTNFLDVCATDTDAAREMLRHHDISDQQVIDIVDRYAKEARRLQVDMKQDRERKVLSIRHRLEAELVDHAVSAEDWIQIGRIVDSVIPNAAGFSPSIEFHQSTPDIGYPQNFTVNFNPQIINKVEGVVAQEITGNQHFGAESHQLIELIKEFGGTRTSDLIASVYLLEDPETKTENKVTAKQKLKGFLHKASGKIANGAFELLQAYLENKIGI